MTNTENPSRRKDDQPAREPLEWESDKKLIAAALAHLSIERAAAGVIPIPCTNPQKFIAIGTVDEIGQRLPGVRKDGDT